MARRKTTNFIVVHCAATTPSMDIDAKWIDREHRKRGFFCIGYHFVVRRDGTVEKGRPVEDIGAHVQGINDRSVGVCMAGGVREDGKTPENNFTPAQWASLVGLLKALKDQYPNAAIKGHSEFANKACPSFSVQDWLKDNPL